MFRLFKIKLGKLQTAHKINKKKKEAYNHFPNPHKNVL